MFSKNPRSPKLDPEQRELFERAQRRARQKRRLYQHFIIFRLGSVLLIVINVLFEIGKNINPFNIDWFVWAILLWGILLLLHFFNVFVTQKFLGKEWEDSQIERLVAKQRERIDELQARVERDHPLPPSKSKPVDPDTPLNS